MSLKQAVERTVRTNPEIGAERAERGAAGYELRQAQGRLLPELDVDGDIGAQKINRPRGFAPLVNNVWRNRKDFGVSVRQTLFSGFDRANDIYKSAARIDAAAWRVMERSEALALTAVEAYIDIRRNRDLLKIARDLVRRHREILKLVMARKEGGKAPESEVVQTVERLQGAEAVVAEVRQSLQEAIAKFRRVVGVLPGATHAVSYPAGLVLNRQAAIDASLASNPGIQAAEASSDVARYEFNQAKSGYLPEVSVEGNASFGADIDGTPGMDNELIGRFVLTWNLFQGLIKVNRRRELAERWTRNLLRRDVRVREVIETIDEALATYRIGKIRLDRLRAQVTSNLKVVKIYLEEYELSKRSLLDLLNSERGLFDSRFELTSFQAVHVFASYQLLAATGKLLHSFRVAPPPEAVADHREQAQRRLGLFRIKIEPLRKRSR